MRLADPSIALIVVSLPAFLLLMELGESLSVLFSTPHDQSAQSLLRYHFCARSLMLFKGKFWVVLGAAQLPQVPERVGDYSCSDSLHPPLHLNLKKITKNI